MDVYSYAMIGYEIITRKKVFSGSEAPLGLLIDMIESGQKPDQRHIDEIAHTLVMNSSDSVIFYKLKDIVYQCWQTKAEDRPKISVVKKRLDKLAKNKQIYDKMTNFQVESLIDSRKLKSPSPICHMKRSSKILPTIKSNKQAIVLRLALFIAIAAIILVTTNKKTNRHLSTKNTAIVFLSVDTKSLIKYEWKHKSKQINASILMRFPKTFESNYTVPDFVKVHNLVFVTSFSNTHNTLMVNLSESSLKWKEIEWKNEYKCRKYIAYKDSIFAVGIYFDHMNGRSMSHSVIKSMNQTVLNAYLSILPYYQAYLYNTTTNKWTQLPNMHQLRFGHSLAVFKGLICAIGGSPVSPLSAECFNRSTNQWTLLPSMNTERQFAAALELNDELYVIGGTTVQVGNLSYKVNISIDSNLVDESVEKYNPYKQEWTKVDSLKQKRMCHVAGVFNGKIHVLGGYSDIIEVYDPVVKSWDVIGVIPKHKIREARFIAVEQIENNE